MPKRWVTNYYGNSKEGEVYVLLEWGGSGEASQRRKYASWNQDLWAWKVEKASLVEATHERKHSDRKVQRNIDAVSRSAWLKQTCGFETGR